MENICENQFKGRCSGRGKTMGYGRNSESAAGSRRGFGRGNRAYNRGLRCEFRQGYMENEAVSKEETLSQEILVLQARLDDKKMKLKDLSDR